MSTDVTEPQPPPAASSEDAGALLDTANSASQHVAVLHVAFMALCAYVLVIVFGTTDMDLLIGKGVKLPVVDVTVPIVGFYAFAPYLVVLVHFNLLLQLQLLSRQLYAFDAAAPKEENASAACATGCTSSPTRTTWSAGPVPSCGGCSGSWSGSHCSSCRSRHSSFCNCASSPTRTRPSPGRSGSPCGSTSPW